MSGNHPALGAGGAHWLEARLEGERVDWVAKVGLGCWVAAGVEWPLGWSGGAVALAVIGFWGRQSRLGLCLCVYMPVSLRLYASRLVCGCLTREWEVGIVTDTGSQLSRYS